MDEYRENNRSLWNEFARIHVNAPLYHLKEFMAGENKLNELERSEVGDVRGKSLLHLQCHFGMDTLSWARLGARVTGVDFSDEAIRIAGDLARELDLPARFVCSDLYDAPAHIAEQFDIVYTSYGVLTWLPDITRWAQVAANFVKPGGVFYIAEFHPFAMVFDDETRGLKVRYPYFTKEVTGYEVQGSYADPAAHVNTRVSYEWNHTMGEIVTALIKAGLRLEYLHEFPFTVYEQLPGLDKLEGVTDTWGFADGSDPIPLMFSIRATKE